MFKHKTIIIIFWTIILLILVYIFYTFSPYTSNLFPKCPFYITTGYKCPGCGSQRAIYSLLNFDIKQALNANPLLVIALPYVLLGQLFEYSNFRFKNKAKWKNKLFGIKAIWLILIAIILFWLIRIVFKI